MTPVFFNGYGEWFIKDCFGNSHPINEFGGYFMMPKEEVEHCIRWKLHDVFRNYYNRLGPVHVAGDFKLTDDDERRYLDRKSILIDSGFSLGLNELEFVEKLLPIFPIQDIDCEFSKFARRNGISINDYYRCYFKIAKQDISDDPNQKKAKYILHEFELPTLSRELETTKIDRHPLQREKILQNEKRIQSLKEFIEWLELQAKNNNINEFDRKKLDCTKPQLLEHLKKWEKYRNTKEPVWDEVKSWENTGRLWSSAERKEICDVMGINRTKNKPSAYEKLIY